MNERQQRLARYFRNLAEPTPPARIDEIFEEIVTTGPAAAVPAPMKSTTESVRQMLEKAPAVTQQTMETALSASAKALNDQEMDVREEDVLEAIILPGKRPVLDVTNGDFSTPPPGWEFLSDYRENIKSLLPAIGRIDVPELLTAPYAGTGFFIGPNLLMTNRHVARIFVEGIGAGPKYLRFQRDRTALLHPKYEVDPAGSQNGGDSFEVMEALVVHPHWDAAILRVRPPQGKPPAPFLKLAKQAPSGLGGGTIQHVIVVGYPMLDTRRNDPVELDQQMSIFRKTFGRKRLMPGYLTGYNDVRTSWDALLHATTHDATTLGGNSGSAVIDLTNGVVLSLHFGGKYLVTNFGVPAWELASDQKIVDLGVSFADLPGSTPGAGVAGANAPIWLSTWDKVTPLAITTTPESGTPATPVTPGQGPTESPSLPLSPDWFERVSDGDLIEAMRRDSAATENLIRQTLLPSEAQDLINDLKNGLAAPAGLTEEEGIFDFLTGTKTDPNLPEIIFIHGIMGGHLSVHGALGGRIWLSPLALAAGSVATRLTLGPDGDNLDRGQILYPDGHIRMVYEKAARKWRIQGFAVHEFAFDWRKSLSNAADRLHLFIESLRLERPTKKFSLVCHSMGGLVAAIYASRHPEWADRVSQAVFLGSPLRGSYVPVEAMLGTYPLLRKLAFVDRPDKLGDYIGMVRSLPGLIDMLPDPDVFPDAAPLYQRANWPKSAAPAQIWLDQSRQLKPLLAQSPILKTARLIVSPGHGTIGEIGFLNGQLQLGKRNRPGDGTVPLRSAASSIPGMTVYRASFSHGELPREASVIQAVDDLLRTGVCQLPIVSAGEINDVAPIEEAIEETIEEAAGTLLAMKIHSDIFTQGDVDFLLRPAAGAV